MTIKVDLTKPAHPDLNRYGSQTAGAVTAYGAIAGTALLNNDGDALHRVWQLEVEDGPVCEALRADRDTALRRLVKYGPSETRRAAYHRAQRALSTFFAL